MYAIIPEVCQATVANLMDVYIRLPATNEEWMLVANAFYAKYQMVPCMGVLDIKQIRIRQPAHSGAHFSNFKLFHSISLIAVCDSNRRFLWVSIGDFDGVNDSSAFARSSLGIALKDNLIEIFTLAIQVSNTHISLTPFLISDRGFGLQRFVLEPYQQNIHIPIEHSIFNIRLGYPRKLIEQGFGIMCRRFKIFDRPLEFNLATIDMIVLACCCLYNFLLDQDQDIAEPRYRYGADDSSDDSDADENVDRDDDGNNDEDGDVGNDENDDDYEDGDSDVGNDENDVEDAYENVHGSGSSETTEGSATESQGSCTPSTDDTNVTSDSCHELSSSDTESEVVHQEVPDSGSSEDGMDNVHANESSARESSESSESEDSHGSSSPDSSSNGELSSENDYENDDLDVDAILKKDILVQYFVSPAGNVDWQ
ncbi:hypothetical protein QAD02_014096 [Eretmocerus hayati]|uniref:Uncharacterized protein n=1 Tax=Eretmocerus hayati TaxID=131215 RepID=A0ACC2P3Y4_9HYME|nr:hypothetical protein QAD02_014096 [Eretmocerus hayati]